VKHWDELTPVEVYVLARLRTEVFLREQGCTEEELDWRDLEATTEHYLLPAEEDAAPGETAGHPALAAYLRVLTDPDAEGDGLYAKAGFASVGEEFDEAGIPHITMVRPA